MTDNVNHPAHYAYGEHEVIEVTRRLGFCAGNAVKYLLRADKKNGVEDLRKAVWYLKDLHEHYDKGASYTIDEGTWAFFHGYLQDQKKVSRAAAFNFLRLGLIVGDAELFDLAAERVQDEIDFIENNNG